MVEFIIGPREIKKAIKAGTVVSVMAANNCPKFLIKSIQKEGADVKTFAGDQKELGTHIGKPFPVALVGQTK
ncbi:MAG: ribosomal L7Ae/L30e/S12e/Gadd45 family protein [Candidatus Aenigmatarchaeota archaeon]